MKLTLKRITELVKEGIISNYAIAGGIAQFYYIEAGATYDLDIMIQISNPVNQLAPLEQIYKWAKKYKYKNVEEHIVIEGIPVQFLLAYNDLVAEAVYSAVEVKIFGVKTFIMKPEYLMAIMLQTNRSRDRERLIKFFEQVNFSKEIFEDLIDKYQLKEKLKSFKDKYL